MKSGALVSYAAQQKDVAQLEQAGLVCSDQTAKLARVKPRTVRVAKRNDTALAAQLARAPKRRQLFDMLAHGPVAVDTLKRELPNAAAHLRALVKQGLVCVQDVPVASLPPLAPSSDSHEFSATSELALTAAQKAALDGICQGVTAHRFSTYLLHGVTGSGKTEVYLRAIAEVVAAGRTAIVLVPEISLTPQLAGRFRSRFRDRVAVLHSGLSDRERFDEWQRLRQGDASIAVGARSACLCTGESTGHCRGRRRT